MWQPGPGKWASIVLFLAAMAAGCSDQKGRAIVQHRGEKIREVLLVARDSENGRVERLSLTANEIARRSVDTTRLGSDIQRVEDQVRFEGQRWQERQPQYLKAIGEELQGDLPKAADTLPHIIY